MTELAITGMTCAACAGRVERALGAVPGIDRVAVNPVNGRAHLTLAAPVPIASLVAAVEAAGYGVRLNRIRLRLDGLQDAIEGERLAAALKGEAGVFSVRVTVATGLAEITGAAGLVDPARLVAASRAIGLEARLLDTPDADKPERLWPALVALLLTLPLLAPMAFGHRVMLPLAAELVLAGAVLLLFGGPILRGAWTATRAGVGSMDQLVSLGALAAWSLSLANLIRLGPGAPLYLESAAAIMAFIRLGKALEARARRRTGAAMAALAALRPAEVRIEQPDGTARRIPVEALALSDRLLVQPGERIAADGRVRVGISGCDESVVTGESRPVTRGPGDRVIAGALALDGALTVEVMALGPDSTLGRIQSLVEAAEAAKAPVQALVDRVVRIFVPVVLGLALATGLGWWLAGAGLDTALITAVSVLVVACPCALGLATPTVLVVAIGRAARLGILVKHPAALDRAARLTLVAFDKTGTLTAGEPMVDRLVPVAGLAPASLLTLAAAIQPDGTHPLARALARARVEQGLSLPPATGIRVLPGRGVEAVIAGARHQLLSPGALAAVKVRLEPALAAECTALDRAGATVSILVRLDPVPTLLGVIGFSDQIRPGAADLAARLARLGITTALVTGDGAGSAARVAAACGIGRVVSAADPATKTATLEQWRAEGQIVAMVGDGINDAPALAAADLGIAIGSGSDVALEAADVALLGSDPTRLVDLIGLARATRRSLIQGLVWAVGFNALALPLAACGALNPPVAAAAMAASSVMVVANALRLARVRIDR